MKTIEDVKRLKEDWLKDPFWDLYTSEGFESYKDELMEFQQQTIKEWERLSVEAEDDLDKDAEKLGIKGLYRLYLEQKKIIDRYEVVLHLILQDKSDLALKVLRGSIALDSVSY